MKNFSQNSQEYWALMENLEVTNYFLLVDVNIWSEHYRQLQKLLSKICVDEIAFAKENINRSLKENFSYEKLRKSLQNRIYGKSAGQDNI